VELQTAVVIKRQQQTTISKKKNETARATKRSSKIDISTTNYTEHLHFEFDRFIRRSAVCEKVTFVSAS